MTPLATSQALPWRLSGMGVSARSGLTSVASRPREVSIRPGMTTLTRIPRGAASRPAAARSPSRAALDAT
jgi:hypothetical protein